MISKGFITELHCPYCGSLLREEIQVVAGSEGPLYGIVKCECDRYPIVDGILILRPVPANLIQLLERRETEGALRSALYDLIPDNARTRKRRRIEGLRKLRFPFASRLARQDAERFWSVLTDREASFQEILRYVRTETYADYLIHRYANPSFFVALGVLSILEELEHGAAVYEAAEAREKDTRSAPAVVSAAKAVQPRPPRVLDLACGTAHTSFLIQVLFPEIATVAADHDFINLYLARRFMAPGATYLCIDAEAPLPFADHSFDAVFCLDAMHYIRSKKALSLEIERTLTPEGICLLPHLHNAKVYNPVPGMPLSAEGYLECFADLEPRLFSEPRLLDLVMHEQRIDLGAPASEEERGAANSFCIVGSRRAGMWRNYNSITARLCQKPEYLGINPIYKVGEEGNAMHLEMQWPNPILAKECARIEAYLPKQHEFDRGLWDRILRGTTTLDDKPAICELVKSYVLVPLPSRYITR
jgi:SAM-dependent methyltransferase